MSCDESKRNSPRGCQDSRKRTLDRKRAHIGKLPSPRELQLTPEEVPYEDKTTFLSISELNPFFEEFDHSSSAASNAEEVDNTSDVVNKLNCDSSENNASFRRIWSSLEASNLPGLPSIGTKSDESMSSASEGRRSGATGKSNWAAPPGYGLDGTGKKDTKSLKHKLKKVSHRVRKQFSATSGFLADKLAGHLTRSRSSLDLVNGGEEQSFKSGGGGDTGQTRHKEGDRALQSSTIHKSSQDQTLKEHEARSNKMPPGSGRSERKKLNSLLLWGIPNWLDNSVVHEDEYYQLEKLIENEKEKIGLEQPLEWANAVEYLRRSVGRDFRRGYLALGEKMQLPNLEGVRCLKFSPFHSFLAIGCEEGTLTVLELDYQKPLHHKLEREEGRDLMFYAPSGSRCRIQMNETLVGHAFDVRCIAWNRANGKLMTSDEIGVIIGWGYGETGCWVEEMINDKSTSMIKDLVWSPDGTKIVIGYQDYTEDGSITGGILVGLADGTQIFDRKFSDSQVNFVKWYNDSSIWVIVNHMLHVFGGKGELKKLVEGKDSLPLISEGASEMTSFMLVPKTSWVAAENSPLFVVVFKRSCMVLYNSITDKSPTKIHTQLTTSCADWSANGIYIVLGGKSVSMSGTISTPQVNLYNYEGKLLQILKLPEAFVSSISWDHDSLHLTVSTGRHVYFANLRPLYKLTSNGTVHCFAYTQDCINHKVGFWNEKTLFKEQIPGKIIDLKCFRDKFAVLFMDSQGIYHILVFGETGVYQKHLCVFTMEPFALTITKNSIVCLAPNAALIWNYRLGDSHSKITGALRKSRQVHLDDFPGIIPKPGERSDHLLKPVMDCARCMHALRDRLCIARESGKLQLYALPTLGFLQMYQLNLAGDICQQIRFNDDGSRLALLTMNGRLGINFFPEASGQATNVIYCDGLTAVSSFTWAKDMPNHLCALDGNNLHIIEDGQVLETVENIPSGCCLANFENLYISLINMDKVIECPENPNPNMLIRLATPTLVRLQDSAEDDFESLDDVVAELNSSPYSHPILKKLVANVALRNEEVDLADSIYTDYAFNQFLNGFEKLEGRELQRAEIYCFLNNYVQAQSYFIRAGRKDLAIKMWTDLGEWDKVNFLSGFTSEDTEKDAAESQYEKCIAIQDWKTAVDVCAKLEDNEGMVDCYIAMENFEKLIDLAKSLLNDDPLLHKIGEVLASYGLVDDAVKCFVDGGNATRAMQVGMHTRNWELAMKLSLDFNLPFMQPALVKHIRYLIETNSLNPAIQILGRCGKWITAGKLLIWKGLCMLESEYANTIEIKKIFVLGARMLSRRTNSSKRARSCHITISSNNAGNPEEMDLEFLIPGSHLQMMRAHNEWCWNDPWRAAEAVHFLNLSQRFLYMKIIGRAFRAAMHLRNFEDIVGSERVNTLVALTAIRNKFYSIASNALLKLEGEDESYSAISFKVFKDNDPENENVERVQCCGCKKKISRFFTKCPLCGTQFTMCIFSASPILKDEEAWSCQTCSRSVKVSRRGRFDYCLLCHSDTSNPQ